MNSYLHSGPVTVAVQETVPISGLSFLMGNDLRGRKIVPDPIVCSEPVDEDPAAETKNQFLDLFPACGVTWSQSQKMPEADQDETGDAELKNGLSELFSENVDG